MRADLWVFRCNELRRHVRVEFTNFFLTTHLAVDVSLTILKLSNSEFENCNQLAVNIY